MRIGILGHFGGKEYFTDGQTVKVKALYNALKKHCIDTKIDIVDTYYLRHNCFKLLMSALKMIVFDNVIIFLPAYGGRKILFQFFYYLSKYLGKSVYHDCIAGSLNQELCEHPEWIKYLNEFEENWMESPEQVDILKTMGVNNVAYVPNFKNLQHVPYTEMYNFKYSIPYKFCIFSRVEPMKGIEDALIAIQKTNGRATLDIYGPIQPGHDDWFEEMKVKYIGQFQYKGVVDPNLSVETLKSYFALIFPTRYFTEGMPGTIIDAMFAGLPVIARKWAWCDNMLRDGYNGIIYDFNKPELLDCIIDRICRKPEIIISMKENCLLESHKYSEETVIKDILEKLKLCGQ